MTYTIALAASTIALAAVFGSACVLLAERKHAPRPFWFVAGAIAAVVMRPFDDWPRVVILAAPVVALLALGDSDAEELVFAARRRRAAWWLKAFILAAAALVILAPLEGGLACIRRSAAAPVNVVRQEYLVLTGGIDRTPERYGVLVTYQFVVDGRTFSGMARREWSSAAVESAKVCYDPADPSGSHALELSRYECGRFDPFHSGDGNP